MKKIIYKLIRSCLTLILNQSDFTLLDLKNNQIDMIWLTETQPDPRISTKLDANICSCYKMEIYQLSYDRLIRRRWLASYVLWYWVRWYVGSGADSR
jgi:hypothetical protein